jgi:hypothetical protein
MEVNEFVKTELDLLKKWTTPILNTLTQEEITWRPACGCNSMGFILFHNGRTEDDFVQTTLQGKPNIWVTEKWYEKLGMAENERGMHYTLDQVNAFKPPEMKYLMAYYDAVRNKTSDYFLSLSPAGFDRKVKHPLGEFTAAGIFFIIIRHAAQHLGEISYLRGMLRGMDK